MDLSQLLDAEIEISGVAGGAFNARYQLMQTRLYVSGPEDLKVLRLPKVRPSDLPLTSIDDVVQTRFVIDQSRRVRVAGAVTYFDPGYSVVIQNGDHSLLALTRRREPLPLGSAVDVTGFADNRDYSPALEDANIVPTGRLQTVEPTMVSYQEAISGLYSNILITLRGRILSELQTDNAPRSMVLMVDSHPVSAVMRGNAKERLPDLPLGTLVNITGICRTTLSGSWGQPLLFRLDMRQHQDLEVVARPSWWTVTHLVLVLGALLVLFLGIMIWAVMLRRRVAS
jgi:hypothetical protein